MFLVEMALVGADHVQTTHGSEVFEDHTEAIVSAMAEMETLPTGVTQIKLIATELSHDKFWTRTYVFSKCVDNTWVFKYFYN